MPDLSVSVIIPCHNAADFVGDAIQSVLDQDYEPVEVIVVDDGSTDQSRFVIKAFDARVQLIEQSNQGACRARNVGASASHGDALLFLDSDDLLGSGTVSALASALNGRSRAISRCPWKHLRRENGRWRPHDHRFTEDPPGDDPVRGWLTGWYVPPCGLLFGRKAFEAVGGWDETLRANQDGDIVLRALVDGIPLLATKNGLALYRDFGGSRDTISSSEDVEAFRSRTQVVDKIAGRLRRRNRFEPYRRWIGRAYYTVARRAAPRHPALGRYLHERARAIGGPEARSEGWRHRLMVHLLGLRGAEILRRTLIRWGVWPE